MDKDTPIILLDEPTTYLDIVHQLDVLHFLKKLNQEQGKTIVMVIHDINLASCFSDYIIALKKGKKVAQGIPEEIITKEVLKEVFHIDATLGIDPVSKKPLCFTYELL